jgi:hypothetical protein
MTILIENKNYKVEADKDALIARMYVGRSKKPSWAYKFRNEEHMTNYINQQIANVESHFAQKAIWKEERKAKTEELKNQIKVGSIFCYSWGWEQTNIDFYQVTEIKGNKLTIREIGMRSVDEVSSMADHVVPVPNHFVGQPESVRLNSYGSINRSCGTANLTDTTSKHYRSWYA